MHEAARRTWCAVRRTFIDARSSDAAKDVGIDAPPLQQCSSGARRKISESVRPYHTRSQPSASRNALNKYLIEGYDSVGESLNEFLDA